MLENGPMGETPGGDPAAGDTPQSTTTPARRTRKRAAAPAEPADAPDREPDEAPAKTTTRRRRRASEADISDDSGESGVEPAKDAPVKRTRRRKAAGETVAEAPAAPAEDEPTEAPAKGRRRAAALSAPTILFMAPEAEERAARTAAAARTGEPAKKTAPDRAAPDRATTDTDEDAERTTTTRRRRSRRTAEAIDEAPAEPAADAADDLDDDDEGTDAEGRRRRRRGRRGRGRGKGPYGDEDEATPAEAEDVADEAGDEPDADGDQLTRRRRRRRRSGSSDVATGADDGVPTVVKIRQPRRASDEVQGVTGSTRLEAKRQRRRDGREQRRTRPPILTESEFLARREAVDRQMVVRQVGDRMQIAVLEDGVLVEHYVTRASAGTMAGNVYLGKVQNVLPSMEAAFVDIGRGRNAVLYAGEVNWDMSGLEGKARSIEQALRSGDSVPVQVTKDPIGHKGARLTSHIALSGRHLVYVPNGNASGISRKLPDTERKRLRDVLKKLVPDGAGVIVRTAAEGASEDELSRDVKRLQAQWDDIQDKAAASSAPALLYEEPDLLIRVVRDLFNEDFRELLIQGDGAFSTVEAYLTHVSPDLVGRLHRHTGTADVFTERRVDEQITKGLDRKVFLPSGGHLVIDRTEAMTVIDVNTGKYTGAGGNLEETVTRNNLEAAEEIVRQLRLRDLGGIIVIDFIDMVLESNRELVLRRLTECLGRDRTKHQVTEITSLGLVQMTRKRIGQGLLEAFSETCEVCKGRGLIMHTEPVGDRPKAATAVKAVAAATSGSTSRRRGRRATVDADSSAETETEQPEYAEEAAAVDEVVVDAELVDEEDIDDEDEPLVTSTRRRARRGGARRRTRP